jgi:hypothetical protein
VHRLTYNDDVAAAQRDAKQVGRSVPDRRSLAHHAYTLGW